MSVPQTPRKLVCSQCEKPIAGAKTVIEGMWFCPDCTYRYDNPGKEIPLAVKPGRPKKQAETLFPLPPKGRP